MCVCVCACVCMYVSMRAAGDASGGGLRCGAWSTHSSLDHRRVGRRRLATAHTCHHRALQGAYSLSAESSLHLLPLLL